MSIRLAGKTVSFTGGFEAMSRDQAIKAIKSCGATFQKQVNKNVDALVTGDSKVGIRKLQAENLGIQIIPASRFQQYLRNKAMNEKAAESKKPAGRPAAVASDAPASRYVREEPESNIERMPWEQDIVPRFGKIPRRGRPAASVSAPRPAPATAPVKRGRPAAAAAPVKKATRSSASVKKIVFAGDFNFPLSQLCKIAEDRGASMVSSMKNADLVVFGSGSSAMHAKNRARAKGLESVSELEFLRSK